MLTFNNKVDTMSMKRRQIHLSNKMISLLRKDGKKYHRSYSAVLRAIVNSHYNNTVMVDELKSEQNR